MAFHSWDTKALVQDLAYERISEADSLKYEMGLALLMVFMTYWGLWMAGGRTWALIFEFLVIMVVTIFGTFECFKANGGATGANFIRNFVCVSWPVNVKLSLLGFLFTVALYYGFPRVAVGFRDPGFVYTGIIYAYVVLLAMAFFWRCSLHLRAVAKIRGSGRFGNDAPSEPAAALSKREY